MEKKKIIIGVVVLIIAIFIGIGIGQYLKNNRKKNEEVNLKISVIQYQYEANGKEEIKNIKVESEEDINKCKEFYEKIKPLDSNEMVDLEIIEDIRINFNDSTYVYIEFGEQNYCYLINKVDNTKSLSKMPEGLYDWAINKVK